jgi:predicted 3-demethylubiquinone-9 3-methyltransferase (glyoxalase superfamily)
MKQIRVITQVLRKDGSSDSTSVTWSVTVKRQERRETFINRTLNKVPVWEIFGWVSDCWLTKHSIIS